MSRKGNINSYLKNIILQTSPLTPLLPATRISVVIPAYNEDKRIKHILESLERQNEPQVFEVIIVDNGSEDGTVAHVKKYTRNTRLVIHLLSERKPGAAAARKTGVDWVLARYAQRKDYKNHHYIALTDADCQVPEDWIFHMLNEFDMKQEPCALSGGYFYEKGYDDTIEKALGIQNYLGTFYTFAHNLDKTLGQFRFRAPNSCFEIEPYVAAGGFIQSYKGENKVLPREGYDLAKRMDKAGYKLFHFSTPIIASPRRHFYQLLKAKDSYYTYERSGRFVHVKDSSKKMLAYALKHIELTGWVDYQQKVVCRIFENNVITPLIQGKLSYENIAPVFSDNLCILLEKVEKEREVKRGIIENSAPDILEYAQGMK